MNPDLLILSATHFEVSHFLSLCPEHSTRRLKTGQQILAGKTGSRSYEILITGPGVFNAAQAMASYLAAVTPVLAVNTGIAGVFKQTNARLGDVAIATQEHYIHTGIQTSGIQNDPLPFDLIAQSSQSRQGIYLMDQQKADHIHENLNQKFSGKDVFNILNGGFITVSTITSSFDQADSLHQAFSPVMEAMEGAACAHVAECHDISMVEIRCASNFVGERDKSKWDFDLAVKNLGQALVAI